VPQTQLTPLNLNLSLSRNNNFYELVSSKLSLKDFLALPDKFGVSRYVITHSVNNPASTSKHLLCLYSVALKTPIKELYNTYSVGKKYLSPKNMEKIHTAQQRIVSVLESKTTE
jgi:hypothetical protein